MKTLLKSLAWLAGVLVAVVVGASAYIYVASERALAQQFDVPLTAFAAPNNPEDVERGRHMVIVHGCAGCHGEQLAGHLMFDEPGIARVRTPNLTTLAKKYTDPELARLIRHGVKRDGTSIWIMPASPHMADDDLGALIAYLRSLPVREGPGTEIELRRFARIGMATGKFLGSAANVPADARPHVLDRSDAISYGRYLVMSACTECHGSQLQGSEFVKSPNLLIAGAYSDEDFERLMRTGKALGGRELGKMSGISRARFAHFTDAELKAIRAYVNEFVRHGGMSMP